MFTELLTRLESDMEERNSVVLVDSTDNEICKNRDCNAGDLADLTDDVEFPQDVTFEALQVLLHEKRIVLIDVRNPDELENDGTIPGSVNVPLPEIPEAFEMEPEAFKEKYKFDLPAKDRKDLVLTCRSGRRILVAESKMKPLGYTHLRLYRGSFKDWQANGGEIL
eukprot:TRINITY_DN31201_c0_g1_i1.p1 TRINITY_DN31201_c0_g1~~TRINITY_DN31201_c0_g1_i1.p1  ORF type:complete len:166 (-),score=46.34 TRINITY_DN31201_c0_g1_i1:47-544(-)